MIILLKMPSQKLTKSKELKPLNAQKGPTCWYYAARLVREFHQLTSYWNPSADRKIEEAISRVRKYETKFDDILSKIGARIPSENELDKIKSIVDGLMPEKMPASEWQGMVKDWYSHSIQEGHKRLSDFIFVWNRTKNLGRRFGDRSNVLLSE